VDKKPGKPSQKARELQFTQVGDCRCSSDNRHIAAISVPKRGRSSSGHSAVNNLRHILTLLNGHRRGTGKGFSGLVTIVGQITDDKDLGVTGNRQIRLDQNPATAIELGAGGFGDDFTQERSLHSGCPDHCGAGNGFEPVSPLYRHGLRVDVCNRRLASHFNS
jgi:hypothetical protein